MNDEQRLIERIHRGDMDAVRTVYMAFKDDLLAIAWGLLRDRGLAEDVVHDVFVSFVRSVGDRRLRGSLRGFLATCSANRARDILRRQKRQKDHAADVLPPESDAEPQHQAQHNDLIRRLQGGLMTLPVEQREVLLLKTRGDLTFRQIAQIQGVSLNTAQGRYRYGMDKLRSFFNGEMEP